MDKYEAAVVALVEGGPIDVEVWREVARSSPSTFHVWANIFSQLQQDEILEECYTNPQFRSFYNGDRSYINRNIEKLSELTFPDIKEMETFERPFEAETTAKAFADYAVRNRLPEDINYYHRQALLSNFPLQQARFILALGISKAGSVPVEAMGYVLEMMPYEAGAVSTVLSVYTEKYLRSLRIREFKDPFMGYVFGSEKLAERLDSTYHRRYGYLSILNVRNSRWTKSFQNWLLRHSSFDIPPLTYMDSVELIRDMEELDDDFFTERRLKTFDRLLRFIPGVRLRLPPETNLRFKEMFLVGRDGGYDNIKRCIVDGRKVFDRTNL